MTHMVLLLNVGIGISQRTAAIWVWSALVGLVLASVLFAAIMCAAVPALPHLARLLYARADRPPSEPDRERIYRL